jgi:colicin import membrane protein
MPEQKESSVLFSLKELMNLEEDRIRQEESSRKAKQEAELQARLEIERRAREDEESRIRAEDERRRSEEQRTREDAARLEAIHQGEVEKARLDAENAARLEQMRHQQEHERQLHALSQDKHKKRLTMAAVGVSLLLVVGAIGGVTAYTSARDKAAAAAAEQARANQELQAQLASLTKQADDEKANMDNLNAQLGAANDVATKLALEKQLAEAKKQAEITAAARAKLRSSGGGGGGNTSGPAKPRAACTCQAGDPLCSCIQ